MSGSARLSNSIFNKDIDKEEDAQIPLEVMEQFRKLQAMIDNGEINEAENILLDGLREGDRTYFEMSLLFYEKLSGKTDEFLAEHDYSRQGSCGRTEICG